MATPVARSFSVTAADFFDYPSVYAHADHFRRAFPDIPEVLISRIAGCPRLTSKLSRVLIQHYRLAAHTSDCDPSDLTIARLDGTTLQSVISIAGATWHARQLRKTVSRKVLAEVLSSFHPQTYAIALSNIDLSPEGLPTENDPIEPALADAIEGDGSCCLSAWMDTLSPAISERIKLKFPEGAIGLPPSLKHRELGPAIIRRTVESLSRARN